MAYATPTEYRARPGVPAVPDDDQLQQLLDDASARLDELTVTAVYATDVYGMPTDVGVASAFRQACITQAAHMQNTPQEDQDGIPQGQMTLGPLTLPATTGTASRYASSALASLRGAGLISSIVLTR